MYIKVMFFFLKKIILAYYVTVLLLPTFLLLLLLLLLLAVSKARRVKPIQLHDITYLFNTRWQVYGTRISRFLRGACSSRNGNSPSEPACCSCN